jgi:sphingolipid delta-4 desaturase
MGKGNKGTKLFKEFEWVYTEEPHASRRREILAKHPEIKELFGPEPLTATIVTASFCFQVFMAFQMSTLSWPVVLLCAYAIGGTINHAMLLAQHEISHNLALQSRSANRWLGMFSNLCTGLPSWVQFQKYHMEHHQFQGVDAIDMDIPSDFEVNFFLNSAPRKLLWVFLQPLFYALRPVALKPKPVDSWTIVNAVWVLAFDACIFQLWGIKALMYLIAGTLLGMGLHPCAGHFISEHYVFSPGAETYSYYGPLNRLTFNVGYHNEHHDFPRIAWSKLPKVRELAPEYYDNLPCYTSWVGVIWRFITDPTIGPYSRVKRPEKSSADMKDRKNTKAQDSKQE